MRGLTDHLRRLEPEAKENAKRIRVNNPPDADGDDTDFEAAMHAHVNEKFSDLLGTINATGDYTDEIEAGLKEAVEDFKRNGTY